MSAILVKADGTKRHVKNLGWLLRNWKEISLLAFQENSDKGKMVEGQLIAFCGNVNSNNDFYETDFASLSVLWNWLDRPVFRGLRFRLTNSDHTFSKVWTIGDTEWKRINKLEYNVQKTEIWR